MRMLKEIYEYREMIISLVRKDLRGRYKGTMLGFLWTFVNPLLQLCIYTIVFSTIMRAGIEQFYIFLFVALVPWIFFSSCLVSGAVSVVNSQDLVKKIYFPRIVLPLAYVTSAFINMLLTFVVVFAVLIITNYGFNFQALLCLPVVMLVEYILAIGIALITSACTVYFRDLEHILGIISMAWMYLTPILYSPEFIPKEYLSLFNMNPLAPIIEAYRDILYYKNVPHMNTLSRAIITGFFVVMIGGILFNKLQKGFVEEM